MLAPPSVMPLHGPVHGLGNGFVARILPGRVVRASEGADACDAAAYGVGKRGEVPSVSEPSGILGGPVRRSHAPGGGAPRGRSWAPGLNRPTIGPISRSVI